MIISIKKLKKMPEGLKASIAFFVANIITAGIAYITTPFFTRMLSSEEFGEVSLYLTWKQVFGIIAMFCLSYGVFNNGMSDFPEKRDEYSFSMLGLSNIVTAVFAFVLFSTYPFTSSIIGLDIPLLILMVLTFLFQPAYNFWIVKQRYEYKYKFTSLWTIVSAIISPVVAMICIYFANNNKVYARLFGSELSLIVLYVFFAVHLGKKTRWHFDTSFWRQALLFNLPLIPHYLSTYLLASSDKIMISALCGKSDTAFYSVAYSVASVGTIVWSAANASLVPFTYEKCKTKKYSDISNVTIPILVLYGIVCVTIILLAPEVVSILGTSEYLHAIYVIPPVIAGIFFQVQYYMYANILYYYKKPKYVMFASVTATISNLVLNYIFIQKYGFIAAGYTTLVCYLIMAVIDYFAMKKVVGSSVYDMKKVVLFSVIAVVICLVSNVIFNYDYVRYFLLVLIICGCIVFRKKLFSAISNVRNFEE